jgi:hypothetical protein
MRFRLLVIALTLLALVPSARAVSRLINIAPVAGFVKNRLVNKRTKTLRLDQALDVDAPGQGITAKAVTKAEQAQHGMAGFNSGYRVGNYVVKMGNQHLILTAMTQPAQIGTVGGASTNSAQLFELRTGKDGNVIARGHVDHVTGGVEFTRSHNRPGKSGAIERSAK